MLIPCRVCTAFQRVGGGAVTVGGGAVFPRKRRRQLGSPQIPSPTDPPYLRLAVWPLERLSETASATNRRPGPATSRRPGPGLS